jgi:hypothetical protein
MKTPDPSAPGDGLDRLLDQARGDGLRSGQVEELWSRVAPLVAPGVPTPHGAAAGGSAGASATSLAGGLGIKTIGVLLVGGGLAAATAGGVYMHWTAKPVDRAATSAVAPSPKAAPANETALPAGSPESTTPTVAVDDLPSKAIAGRATPKGRVAAGGDARDVPRSAMRPLVDRDVPSFGAEPSGGFDGPSTPSQASRSAQDPPLSASPSPGAAAPSSPPPNEGSLLLRARQALDVDPGATLALTQEHARRFPTGTLAPEREVLAIEALARLGRTSEARARLDSFRSRYPQSPHLSKLDALVNR